MLFQIIFTFELLVTRAALKGFDLGMTEGVTCESVPSVERFTTDITLEIPLVGMYTFVTGQCGPAVEFFSTYIAGILFLTRMGFQMR